MVVTDINEDQNTIDIRSNTSVWYQKKDSKAAIVCISIFLFRLQFLSIQSNETGIVDFLLAWSGVILCIFFWSWRRPTFPTNSILNFYSLKSQIFVYKDWILKHIASLTFFKKDCLEELMLLRKWRFKLAINPHNSP